MKAYEMAAELKGLREEVERLRHDIERHIAIASELATENERLRAELAEAKRDAERYRWLTLTSDTNPLMVYEVASGRLLFGYEADVEIDIHRYGGR